MTPERLEEIRADLVEMPVLAKRTHANDLLAELDRLRAAVERLADKDQTYHHVYGDDLWVKVTDVLAALEGE